MTTEESSPSTMKYAPAFVLGLGAFMATFDVTAVSLALPAINESFSLDVADYVWVMSAYSLAFTVMLIAAGAVADRYGHKTSLLAGTIVFLTASALCGLATSYSGLISGRILQGVAAAFMVCGGYALVGRQYVNKADRVQAFAIVGTIAGSAMAVGPGIGGFITSTLGWQWVFLLKIPICLVILAGTVLWITDTREPNRSATLDIAGTVTFSLALFLASWALLNGPVFGSITLSPVWVGLALAGLIALFITIEVSVRSPAVDIYLFGRKSFLGLSLVPVCLAISYWSLIVYVPLFLESSLGLALKDISYIMLFFTVPMFAVPYMVTGIATKWEQSVFYCTGLFTVGLGCLCIAASAYFQSLAAALCGMTIAGIGAAAIQTQVSGALIASAPPEKAGSVSAIMTVLRQGGFVLGSAFLSGLMVVRIGIGEHMLEGFSVLFLTCAVVAGFGGLAVFLLVRTEEQTK